MTQNQISSTLPPPKINNFLSPLSFTNEQTLQTLYASHYRPCMPHTTDPVCLTLQTLYASHYRPCMPHTTDPVCLTLQTLYASHYRPCMPHTTDPVCLLPHVLIPIHVHGCFPVPRFQEMMFSLTQLAFSL